MNIPFAQWIQQLKALFMDYRKIYLCDIQAYLDYIHVNKEMIVLHVF